MQFGSQHVSCGIQMGNDDKRINISLRYIICQTDSKQDRIINQGYIYIYIYIYIYLSCRISSFVCNILTIILQPSSRKFIPNTMLNNKVKHICHCWKIGKSHLIMVLSLFHIVFESLRYHIPIRMEIIQHIC